MKISCGLEIGLIEMLINCDSTPHSLRTLINYCGIIRLLLWWETHNACVLINLDFY